MMRHDGGTSFIELMVALAIMALCIVPIFEFFTRMSEVPAVSEDTVYAEVLATRVLERYGSRPFDELAALTTTELDGVVEELFEDDRKDDWFIGLPEYKNSLGVGKGYFKGSLDIKRLEDHLLALDVVIRWRPANRGAKIDNTYSYALTKFVSRTDLGVTYQQDEPEL